MGSTVVSAPPPAASQPPGQPPVSRANILGSIAGVIAGIALFVAPIPLSPLGKATLGLSVWMLVWCVSGLISVGYTSLIYLLGLILLQYKSTTVWGMLTISAGWFLIAAFVFAAVMLRCGLAKRVAYFIMYRLRGNTPARFLFVASIISMLMVLLIPSPIANMAVIFPIYGYVVAEWDLAARNEAKKGASAVGIIGAFLVIMGGVGGFWLKTGFSQNLVALSIARTDVTFAKWFLIAAPTMWIFAFVFPALVLLFFRFPKHIVAPAEVLAKKYRDLGPMTGTEKKVLLIACLLFALYSTESFHHIAAGWIALFGLCLFALPWVKVFPRFEEMFASENWGVIFLTCGLYALAFVFRESGITGMLVHILAPLQPHTRVGFYLLSGIFGTFVTGIVTLNVSQAVVVPLFTSWGQSVGLSAAHSFLAIWLSSGGVGANLLAPVLPSFCLAWTFKYKGTAFFTFRDAFVMTMVAYVVFWIVALPCQLLLWPMVH